jgi:hypothetical protein
MPYEELIRKIKVLLHATAKSRAQFSRELNQFLTKKRPETQASYIVTYRWLNGHKPRKQTQLAMLNWLRHNTPKT